MKYNVRGLSDEVDGLLVGRLILGIYRNEDSTKLKFETGAAPDVFLSIESGSRSESWVEEILNAELLIGAIVTMCESLDLESPKIPQYPPSERQEYDKSYGWAIHGTKGTATVIYRNSSNGYYGGSLDIGYGDHDLNWTKIA